MMQVGKIRMLLMCFIIVSPSTVLAENVFVYRWIDPVDGDVHYGQDPPEKGSYEMLHIDPAPPPDPTPKTRTANIDAEVDQYLQERQRRQRVKRLQAAEKAARMLDCQRARDWLAKLRSRPGPHILIIAADGSGRRMTEKERQAHIKTTKQKIGQLCIGRHD